MTKTTKDRVITGIIVGVIVSMITLLSQSFIAKNKDVSIIVSEKIKTDAKNEVIKEIKPEIDKKLDKIIFDNYKENQEKYQDLKYKNLDEKIDLILKGLGIAYKKDKK